MDNKVLQQIIKRINNHEKRIGSLEGHALPKKKKRVLVQTETLTSNDLVLSLVNKIGECDESEEIQSKVIDQTGMEGKILLCFYISYKYFKNQWLSSSDIEKITSELGIKITIGNASNKIKDIRQYFESGTTRKTGQPTPYKLNRKGARRFEEILHTDSSQTKSNV